MTVTINLFSGFILPTINLWMFTNSDLAIILVIINLKLKTHGHTKSYLAVMLYMENPTLSYTKTTRKRTSFFQIYIYIYSYYQQHLAGFYEAFA